LTTQGETSRSWQLEHFESGEIGPGAAAAIPALTAAYESLKPDDEDRKYELLDALPKIGAPPSLRIIGDLDDPDPDRRANAAMILSQFGAKAHSAAGRLFKAVQALTRIDGGHEAILPALIELVSVEPAPTKTKATKAEMSEE
jgi:hypothetical protein